MKTTYLVGLLLTSVLISACATEKLKSTNTRVHIETAHYTLNDYKQLLRTWTNISDEDLIDRWGAPDFISPSGLERAI